MTCDYCGVRRPAGDGWYTVDGEWTACETCAAPTLIERQRAEARNILSESIHGEIGAAQLAERQAARRFLDETETAS